MIKRGLYAGVFLFLGAVAAPAQSVEGLDQTLRVDLDLVLVPVTVTDGAARPVTGLEASDFMLWEDRIQQHVEYFSVDTAPATVGIVLDVSESMEETLPAAREAVRTFLDVGDADDEYFLLEFSNYSRLRTDFTSEIRSLGQRLMDTQPSRSTALYDAVYQAVSKVQDGSNPRKVLLIVTDGEDNRSRYSQSHVEDYLRESGVQVYSIGISATLGKARLQSMAEVTGGRAVFVDSDANLLEVSRQLALEMKSQYVLGYSSSNQRRDGEWREIRVRVVPGSVEDGPVSVRTRRGYYASAY